MKSRRLPPHMPGTTGRSEPDWEYWLRRWDDQQERFNPQRERRFSVMFDIAEASVGRRFLALDLGSGPGSLSIRLLRRFPAARSVAVDYDPVTLRVGQGATVGLRRRLRWVDARLGRPGWINQLPARRFDLALSTTALHWLPPSDLRRLYRDLARLLRRGGIFLNGDIVPWGPEHRELAGLSERVRRIRLRGAASGAEWSGWEKWWSDVRKVPELGPLFGEQERRHSQHPTGGGPTIDVHLRALERAGFREAAVLWQDLENRILFARR